LGTRGTLGEGRRETLWLKKKQVFWVSIMRQAYFERRQIEELKGTAERGRKKRGSQSLLVWKRKNLPRDH